MSISDKWGEIIFIGDLMKNALKTFLMIVALVLGILYVDYTINSLMGTPKILVIDYAKEQIWQALKNVPK